MLIQGLMSVVGSLAAHPDTCFTCVMFGKWASKLLSECPLWRCVTRCLYIVFYVIYIINHVYMVEMLTVTQ